MYERMFAWLLVGSAGPEKFEWHVTCE